MEYHLGVARIPLILLAVASLTAKGSILEDGSSKILTVRPPTLLKLFEYGEELSRGRGKIVLAFSFVLILFVLFGTPKKRQRLVPGIPVVGGDYEANVLKNRKRFVHDGKDMLLEGYQKAMIQFFDLHLSSVAECFK